MRVVCLVEQDEDGPIDASLRAVTFARGLLQAGGHLDALVVGPEMPTTAETLSAYGVTRVLLADPSLLAGFAPLAWARLLSGRIAEGGITAAVAASSDRGVEIMAHAGALTGLPMAANCTEATALDAGRWSLARQRFGGSLIERATLGAPTALMTVATDAVAPLECPAQALPAVERLAPVPESDDLAVRATEVASESGGVSLSSARVVVSGGRGVGGAEGFEVVEELAALLGGAVGVSRAVTSLGWRPHAEQVGQTGTKVTPELYLACGISGAIQHLAGCQSAKTMVAINTDGDAPIMSRADYAVIGDVHEVLPALAEALRARR